MTDPPEGGYKAEALRMRCRYRGELAVALADLPELDRRGMSAEVRAIATAAGIPLDELHPFDHRRVGGRPICELTNEELHQALPRRTRGKR